MRREAGSYVRRTMTQLGMLGTAGAGILIGLGIAPMFFLIDRWAGGFWAVAAYLGTAAVGCIVVSRIDQLPGRWNFDDFRKGRKAENRVGQAIGYAVTAENCAVAHSVTEIAKVGDIDHIVATPEAIWVIETKFKKVPRKDFFDVLTRIAVNVDAVRQWAPDGTPVRGCLVLAYEGKAGKKNFNARKEQITAYFTPQLLMHEIRAEAGKERSLDGRIAKDIWKLGHVAE